MYGLEDLFARGHAAKESNVDKFLRKEWDGRSYLVHGDQDLGKLPIHVFPKMQNLRLRRTKFSISTKS
jgi:hypothetical protein